MASLSRESLIPHKAGRTFLPDRQQRAVNAWQDAWGNREKFAPGIPIVASYMFIVKRPAAHLRTNGELKDWAPVQPPMLKTSP